VLVLPGHTLAHPVHVAGALVLREDERVRTHPRLYGEHPRGGGAQCRVIGDLEIARSTVERGSGLAVRKGCRCAPPRVHTSQSGAGKIRLAAAAGAAHPPVRGGCVRQHHRVILCGGSRLRRLGAEHESQYGCDSGRHDRCHAPIANYHFGPLRRTD
jgi:hypothetical protein